MIISKAYLVIIVGILYLTLIYVSGATFPRKAYKIIIKTFMIQDNNTIRKDKADQNHLH